MPEDEIYDLIIVGGGPGGLTAGLYAMRAALKTVLIEKGLPGGQVAVSDEVENWPGTERISGAELSMKFAQHAQSYGLEIVSKEVVAIEPGLDFHSVRLDDETVLKTHAVIMGTGGSLFLQKQNRSGGWRWRYRNRRSPLPFKTCHSRLSRPSS
jgi:thioredoxin reductase (NADPH)